MSLLDNSQKSVEIYTTKTSNGLLKTFIPESHESLDSNEFVTPISCGLISTLSTCSQSTRSTSPTNRNQWPDFSLTHKDVVAFKRLLDEPIVEELLNWDKCCLLADKYLLATALTYFKRANLRHQQYTPCYLFVALYLAHDMEEDDLDLKNDLVRFAMCDSVSNSKLKLFLRKRDKLWHAMGLRAAVNHICCEALMRHCLPNHKIWRRQRPLNHSGVTLPMHVKNVVHKELGLVNSYIECNIRCIVCESRRFMHFKKSVNSTVKPIISKLNADSAPFVPQSNLQQYFCSHVSEE